MVLQSDQLQTALAQRDEKISTLTFQLQKAQEENADLRFELETVGPMTFPTTLAERVCLCACVCACVCVVRASLPAHLPMPGRCFPFPRPLLLRLLSLFAFLPHVFLIPSHQMNLFSTVHTLQLEQLKVLRWKPPIRQ